MLATAPARRPHQGPDTPVPTGRRETAPVHPAASAVSAVSAAKDGLRARLRQARAARSLPDRRACAAEISTVALATPEVAAAATVAAYVGRGGEPATDMLLAALLGRGVRVLLPVLRADLDLDWGEYAGPGALAPRSGPGPGRGLLEPTGPRLGGDAIAEADALLVPGLAVDACGTRLGQGGGSYDRALARVAPDSPGRFVAVLLYDEEVLPAVPAEPHDRAVHAALTPGGLHRFGDGFGGGRGGR